MPPGGLHIRWPDPPLEQEARLMDFKWYAALAYVRANKPEPQRHLKDSPNDRFGIIASGKAYNDTRQALPTSASTTTPAARHRPAHPQGQRRPGRSRRTITRELRARSARRSSSSRRSAR